MQLRESKNGRVCVGAATDEVSSARLCVGRSELE